MYPENYRYSKEHEWVKVEGGSATIGLTDFAQQELGDIVYVEFDAVDADVSKDGVFGTVEAVKTVSELFMPVSGHVDEVNEALDASPELVNDDPYGEGWLIRITVHDPSEIDGLLTAEQYEAMVGG